MFLRRILETKSPEDLSQLLEEYAKGESLAEKSMAISLMRMANSIDSLVREEHRIANAIEHRSDDGK